MTSGETDKMIAFSQSLAFYPKPVKEKVERDRSLSGKARRRARKAARRT